MLLLSGGALSAEKEGAGASAMLMFQDAFERIAKDEGDAFSEYKNLRSIYSRLAEADKRQAAQLLSMADAIFGRYQEAEDHYYAAFPKGRKPIVCPVFGVSPQPVQDALRRFAADVQVVLINESHSIMATRALIYRLLPMLHGLGFKYLALEALTPATDVLKSPNRGKALQDASLPGRGYPLDQSAAGLYLREPIYAEIVRKALALGFTLVAYETLQAESRDEREAGQANALAKLIEAEPGAKVAVIAGYSHIWKSDGWMADRLQKQVKGGLLSIDLTSGLWGCEEAFNPRMLEPYILIDEDGHPWAAHPDRVDVTVIHQPRKDGRSAPSGWLTLGGARKGVRPDTAACAGAWPCLVSAFYASEMEGAVPADRVLLEGASDKSLLFLKPGKYRYVVEPNSRSKQQRQLKVP
jgi:hypothetical protein